MSKKEIEAICKKLNPMMVSLKLIIISFSVFFGFNKIILISLPKDMGLNISYILAIVTIGAYWTYTNSAYRKAIDKIILDECDTEKYLEITKYAVEYSSNLNPKSYQKGFLISMQNRYFIGLMSMGVLDMAEQFLCTTLKNGSSKVYRLYKCNFELNKAYLEGNAKSYNDVYKISPNKIKKDALIVCYGLMLEKNYTEVIAKLLSYTSKYLYNKVFSEYLLAKSYIALSDYDSAKPHLEFVIQNGNTMPCKREAEELLKEIGS